MLFRSYQQPVEGVFVGDGHFSGEAGVVDGDREFDEALIGEPLPLLLNHRGPRRDEVGPLGQLLTIQGLIRLVVDSSLLGSSRGGLLLGTHGRCGVFAAQI